MVKKNLMSCDRGVMSQRNLVEVLVAKIEAPSNPKKGKTTKNGQYHKKERTNGTD
jgi:hypothetical protein